MTDSIITSKASDVVTMLSGLATTQALQALNIAMGEVLEQVKDEIPSKPLLPVHPLLLKRCKGNPSIIKSDDEIRSFIHGIKQSMTLDQIHEACVDEFGKDRAPSRSSVHRYLQSLKYPNVGGHSHES